MPSACVAPWWCAGTAVPGGVWYRVGIPGGYSRVGIPGVLPSDRARKTHTSEAGPGRPSGPGVGGYGSGRVYRRLGGLGNPPLRGPVAYGLPGYPPLRNAASWPIRARFEVISTKVSQNGGVSPKSV